LIYQFSDGHIHTIPTFGDHMMFNKHVPPDSLIVCVGENLDGIEIPSYISNIIFDDCTNPVNVEQHLQQINLDRPYTILSGSYNYYQTQTPDPRIKFFPFWVVWSSYQKYQKSDKTKKFSCLNGSQWVHRKLTYLELVKKNYFNDMIFTFGNRPIPRYTMFSDTSLSQEEELEFSKLPNPVSFIDNDATIGIDISINHPAYLDCYVNLVTETTTKITAPMLSEKTFKPILSHQLFVLIASPGAVQFLRDIGLDTFDDIIDHSYDTILSPKDRIQQALVQLDRLDQLDLKSVYNKISDRLDHNAKYLTSNKFRDQFNFWLN
jgi:hypothetical protein